MRTRTGGGRQVRLALAVVLLLGAGCERSTDRPPAAGTAATLVPVPTAAPGGALLPGERRPDPMSSLVRAGTCARFGDAARAVALESVGPYGFTQGGSDVSSGMSAATTSAPAGSGMEKAAVPAAAAPPTGPGAAGPSFSGTNVQEAGVDEPDLVKTDGRLLVTITGGRLRVVDVSGPPRQVGALDLPGGGGNLLLVGRRALVLSDGGRPRMGPLGPSVAAPAGGPASALALPRQATSGRPTTTVAVVDLTDPASPTISRTHTLDGSYVDARLIGGVARIVTRSWPQITFPLPQDQQALAGAEAANARLVRNARASAFLPSGASCADAYVPVEASGVGTIAVQSLDPAAESPGPAVTVLADASTVYASASRLFVATNRYGSAGPLRPLTGTAPAPAAARTAIHAFDITDPAQARYVGSGDVPGRLLGSFSLSEDGGVLRVATTLDGSGLVGGDVPGPVVQPSPQPGPSQSRVTILRPSGGTWVETGAVDGLGRGERIYAVRFLGPVGYVVTFRQVDPLYVLDLRDVHAPKVTGELKITGYSAYLHPAGERRLLGIGQEATDQGRRAGTQLSLFDVGDPAAPAKLAGAVLPSASSEAEADHHAFLFWPATGLVVAPVQSYGPPLPQPGGGGSQGSAFVGAVAFHVGDRTVTEAGRITHPGAAPIDRSIVVGGRLLTLSAAGLGANDLTTLAAEPFLSFG